MPTTASITLRAFLTARATTAVAYVEAENLPGLLMAARDTDGLFPEGFLGFWPGPDATAFLRAHEAELIPGRCVDVELSRISCGNGKVRARIKSCQLSPLSPSWKKHEDKTKSTTPEKAPA